MTGTCPLCGEIRRLEWHHPSGRIRGRAIHPNLVFLICWVCNNDQWILWMRLGIADEMPDGGVVARRLACWIEQWGTRPMTQQQARALALAVAGLPALALAA